MPGFKRAELEAEVSDQQIDLIVSQLRRVCRQATMEYALNVGRIIIHNFYDGDITGWRGRGAKRASFRRLACRPDLPMSAVLLYRCVATYELCERVDALSRWSNINVSHIRAVLNLPDEKQVELLSLANAERWSVRRLEERAGAVRSAGRSQHRRSTNHLLRALKALSRALSNQGEQIEPLLEADAPAARQLLQGVRESLEKLDSALALLDDAPASSWRPALSDGAPSDSSPAGAPGRSGENDSSAYAAPQLEPIPPRGATNNLPQTATNGVGSIQNRLEEATRGCFNVETAQVTAIGRA